MPDLSVAQSLLRENKPEAALLHLQRLAAKHPKDPGVHSLTGQAHLMLGRPQQALFFAQRAADLAPNSAAHLANLGAVLLMCNQPAQAISTLRLALDLDPQHQDALRNLANVLLTQHQAGESLDLCRRALTHTWDAATAATCAEALRALGDHEEAAAFLKSALANSPNNPALAASLAQVNDTLCADDPAAHFQAHLAMGRLTQQSAPRLTNRHTPNKDPGRKLRVGLLSPDLRQHSVAYFIEPFLESHDRTSFEVICYANGTTFDAVSRRLKSHAALWREVSRLSDQHLAQQFFSDRIDIAIDLAGHTRGNRLSAFAARLAPIQVTYLGYPDTTGLTTMDYRIVDSLTDPPGSEQFCTERVIRLDPCFLCFMPPGLDVGTAERGPSAEGLRGQPPIRTPQPAITFGSFNDARKLTPRTFTAWSRILDACPASILVLKSANFRDPAVVHRITAAVAQAGMDPARVRILPPSDTIAQHLVLYHQVDIALDPMFYNGTTTTCEALWMGVPVVTLAGSRHAARVGVSLLTNTGCPELIASTDDEYVRIATALAQDRPRLAEYRRTLRHKLTSSPLCNGPAFARRLESALRTIWQEACHATI